VTILDGATSCHARRLLECYAVKTAQTIIN
jgi:hypothetical protein